MRKDDQMTNYKIVASDLDGTLFLPDMTISEENEAAIKELSDMGIYFVPSSGRTFTEIPKNVREHPLVRYIIFADGAGVYDKQQESVVVSKYIPHDSLIKLLDILSEYQTILTLRTGGRSYVDATRNNDEEYAKHRMSVYYRDFVYDTNNPIDNFDVFCRSLESAEMIAPFFADDDEMAECKRRLEAEGDYIVASSERYNLEIFSVNAGKGNTLLALADSLEIPHCETIGVGDTTNDMNLIQSAGLGLAMSNAYQELKDVADAVICSNTEHAIKYILENYIKDSLC